MAGAKDFTSHLLSFEEGLFVREHPFDIASVRVKRAVGSINATRAELERLEAQLEEHVQELNKRMAKT